MTEIVDFLIKLRLEAVGSALEARLDVDPLYSISTSPSVKGICTQSNFEPWPPQTFV